jgi:integrative and conjugative element protein (TIGR02256 family)
VRQVSQLLIIKFIELVNMKYNYPILSGKNINQDDLHLARAQKIARVISNHTCLVLDSLQFIKKENGDEVIICTLDVEISQKPKNGIQAYENIAIICSYYDNDFPEVYALRDNFKTGLAHTNAKSFEYPINLCITEDIFVEVRHNFSEFEFIDKIIHWFSKTAEGKLHTEEQPLEPFFIANENVIIKNDLDFINGTYLSKPEGSSFYFIQSESSNGNQYVLFDFTFDDITHGFVQKIPSNISDLNNSLTIKNRCFSEIFKDYLESIFDTINDVGYAEQKIAIICRINLKRKQTDTSSTDTQFLVFFTNESMLSIGNKSNYLHKQDGFIVKTVNESFKKEVIDKIEINMKSVIFDFNYRFAAYFNNQEINEDEYTLIGAGSLGSQLFENMVRTGFGKWHVIDNDILAPHNLAKHILNKDDVGFNKAERICNKANNLVDEQIATAHNTNFLDVFNDESFIRKIEKSKAIIDMSTSIAVARTLARDCDKDIISQRISIFINPNGTDLVILAEDKKRKHKLDLLEMQYYRSLYYESNLKHHLQFDQKQKVRYNRSSCREITNRINHTDVSLLSSIATKTVKSIINSGDASIQIWSIGNNSLDIDRYSFNPSYWQRKIVKGWKVYLDKWLLDKMRNQRESKLPNETGGILMGSYDVDRKIIYVCDTIMAPKDSIETQTSFERGKQGLLDKYVEYLKVTDSQLFYIGEWHSHPKQSSIKPSSLDAKLYDFLYTKMSKQGFPVIMIILGDNDFNVIYKDPYYEI